MRVAAVALREANAEMTSFPIGFIFVLLQRESRPKVLPTYNQPILLRAGHTRHGNYNNGSIILNSYL